MDDNKETYYSLMDIINSSKSFLKFLRKKLLLLILIVIAGGGLGIGLYYVQKPKYEAVCTFILEEKSSGGGGLAGLASQFGVNIGSMGGGSIFSGDNILNILTSKKIVKKVLLSRLDETALGSKTLCDSYLEFSGLKKSWKAKPEIAAISFADADKQISPLQDSVLNIVYESIVRENLQTSRTSKQGSIIKVQVTAPDGVFARLMTERLVEEASKMYLDIRVGTAQESIDQLQRRSDSLLMLLNVKSYRAAATQPLDINPGIRTAIVPVEIANRDKTVLATLYAEVTKNLEACKVLLSQQTPVIQLLDQPGFLLDDNKKSMPFLIIFCGMAAGFLSVLFIFCLFLFQSFQDNHARTK